MASRKLFRTRFSSARRPIDNKRRSSTARAKVRLMLEYLEDRLAPATFADTASGGTILNLVLTNANTNVAIVANANDFTTSGSNTFTNKSLTTPGDFTVSIPKRTPGIPHTVTSAGIAAFTNQISLVDGGNTGPAGTSVTFSGSGNNYTNNFNIALTNTSPAAGAITFNGASSFTDTATTTAALTASTTGAVTISSGATVTQQSGTLSLTAGGSLAAAVDNGTADITAPTITLAAGGTGTIGTSATNRVEIDATTLNASTAGGDIFITDDTTGSGFGCAATGIGRSHRNGGRVSDRHERRCSTDANASTARPILLGATIAAEGDGCQQHHWDVGDQSPGNRRHDPAQCHHRGRQHRRDDTTVVRLGRLEVRERRCHCRHRSASQRRLRTAPITNANGTTLNITGGTVDLTANVRHRQVDRHRKPSLPIWSPASAAPVQGHQHR